MILAAALQGTIAQQNQRTIRVPTTIIDSHGDSCPPKEKLNTAIKSITNSAAAVMQEIIDSSSSQLPQCGDSCWNSIQQNQHTIRVPTTVIDSHGDSCPPKEELNTAVKTIRNSAAAVMQEIIISSPLPQCGDGVWHRVAHINMSDPSQQCPSAWREVSMDGIRVCARPNSTEGSCPGVVYHTSGQYSKICGRAIGYQFGSPDAFRSDLGVINNFTIDEIYVEGLSITHGHNPRKHIWSYAAGTSEINRLLERCSQINCPCNGGYGPPNYVGNNYYCESAHKNHCWVSAINRFFPDDPLWDGQQCDNDEGTCCTGANTPPWFVVDLPDSTSDDIEVRICHNQDTTDEDTPIQLLELFIQ